jgi:hypothetical protein
MGQKYALINTGTGLLSGGFLDATVNNIVSPPTNAVPITLAQWTAWVQSPTGYMWNGSTVVAVTPTPNPTTGASTQAAGCTVHSTGTSAMNGTYPCDWLTLGKLQGDLAYVVAKTAFPGGLSTLSLVQSNGTTIYAFASTTLFTNFVNALTTFAAQCAQYDLLAGVGITLPGTQTIA